MFIKPKEKLQAAPAIEQESNGQAPVEGAVAQAAVYPVRRLATPGPRARCIHMRHPPRAS